MVRSSGKLQAFVCADSGLKDGPGLLQGRWQIVMAIRQPKVSTEIPEQGLRQGTLALKGQLAVPSPIL
jgi:hypothetical protein